MPKPAIVFLPGLLCDARIWRDQADEIADLADPFIADLTLDESVDAIAVRVLSSAPDRFVLAGISMGGYVAFEIMRQAPERVLGLALFDTSAAPDTPARAARRRAGMDSLKVGRFAGVTRKLLPELVHERHLDGPVATELQAMAARVGGEAFLRQQQAILDRPDSRLLLPLISVPTLVAVGDRDVLTPPADSLDIHIGIRTSQFVLIRDCGHLPAIEQPQETTELLKGLLKRIVA
ncbi:alpha/beta fold hydrolase [Rhizobium hainanense]|uniref:Pimeloyl-ACP methyl ester carboxylesterase n=1 Tax=Rhizobium hainanense TaxID=52131 RepID=A0A1C3VC56_9HYPH|nr:alpha/beta hydrolase [Rhizobium hainanense]SCB25104.1 Pimeloyl-ACP methyl ester carboxylesterase [Rhizobium hainanense]